MDERALICAWLRRYIAELDAAARDCPASESARLAHESEATRTILWAIESGDYLTDLAGGTAH